MYFFTVFSSFILQATYISLNPKKKKKMKIIFLYNDSGVVMSIYFLFEDPFRMVVEKGNDENTVS